MSNSIPFGIDILTNKLLDSRQVKRGLACGCVCPECNAPLEAVHGKKRKWHFRHAKGATVKTICIHPLESSIHMKAKELFGAITVFKLPKVSIKPGNKVDEIVFAEAKDYYITKVESEYRQDGNDVIPDIVLFSGEEKIYVEILVSHAVDDKKIEKLQKRGVPTLEIDLGKDKDFLESLTEDEFKTIIFECEDNKEWVYTKEIYDISQRVLRSDHLRYLYSDGHIANVANCPYNETVNADKYTNENCGSCKFCISIDPDDDDDPMHFGTVICSARAGFSLSENALSKEEIEEIIVKKQKERKQAYISKPTTYPRHNQKPEPIGLYKKNETPVILPQPPIEQEKNVEIRIKVADTRGNQTNTTAFTEKKSIIPSKPLSFKCIKCGKEDGKSSFKAMRSTEAEAICDECILKGRYSQEEKNKIYYCPKCGVQLYRKGRKKECGSFICKWTLPL